MLRKFRCVHRFFFEKSLNLMPNPILYTITELYFGSACHFASVLVSLRGDYLSVQYDDCGFLPDVTLYLVDDMLLRWVSPRYYTFDVRCVTTPRILSVSYISTTNQ